MRTDSLQNTGSAAQPGRTASGHTSAIRAGKAAAPTPPTA